MERNVAASDETQALSALLFLYAAASRDPAPHQLLRNSRSRRNTSLGEG
ncbi:hypothetical protein [Immundisolibacter cernigliae]